MLPLFGNTIHTATPVEFAEITTRWHSQLGGRRAGRNLMRVLVLAVGLATIFPFSAFAEKHYLDGAFKLLSSTRKIVDSG